MKQYRRGVLVVWFGVVAFMLASLSVAAFAPTDIADLQLWLKADAEVYEDAGTNMAEDGDPVVQWNDQSGNGNHAARIGSTGNLTYETAELGGLPVIALTDANGGDYLRTVGYQPADDDDLTVFVVARAAAQTLDGSIFHPLVMSGDPASGSAFMITVEKSGAGGAGNLGYFGRGYGAIPYDEYTSDADTLNFSDGKGHVIVLALTGATGNGTFTGHYDGEEKETHAGETSDPANGPVEIGGSSSHSSRRFAGAFAEILIYNRALTEVEHNVVGVYLQEKYALSGAYRPPRTVIIIR